MTDNERRRLETFIRIKQFGADQADDFPPGSIAATQFGVIGGVIGEVEQFSGDQLASFGGARQLFVAKDTARENLREEMSDITRTARSMVYQFDGIDAEFRLPRNRNDQDLLAAARAFHENSAEYEAAFVEYGLPAAFRAELQAAIDAFEASLNPTGTAVDEQVAATAQIGEAIRRGMIARRILEAVVKNKYRSNVGKLAAWLSASHIERAPKKEKTPVTT